MIPLLYIHQKCHKMYQCTWRSQKYFSGGALPSPQTLLQLGKEHPSPYSWHLHSQLQSHRGLNMPLMADLHQINQLLTKYNYPNNQEKDILADELIND